jgi:tetratricopeptide (TPR) repeat protein
LIDLGLAPSVEEALSKMMEAAERAVQLDPNDGEAHLALGQAYGYLPHALDYAYLAIANAYWGRTGDAEAAAANAIKMNPTWIAEGYLSGGGGYAEKEAECLSMVRARPDCPTACLPTS